MMASHQHPPGRTVLDHLHQGADGPSRSQARLHSLVLCRHGLQGLGSALLALAASRAQKAHLSCTAWWALVWCRMEGTCDRGMAKQAAMEADCWACNLCCDTVALLCLHGVSLCCRQRQHSTESALHSSVTPVPEDVLCPSPTSAAVRSVCGVAVAGQSTWFGTGVALECRQDKIELSCQQACAWSFKGAAPEPGCRCRPRSGRRSRGAPL